MKEHIFNHINEIHKREPSLVYHDFSSSLVYNDFSSNLVYNHFSWGFSELLEKDRSVTIHYRNFEHGAWNIERIFSLKKSNYDIGNRTTLQDGSIKTFMYGLGTVLNKM